MKPRYLLAIPACWIVWWAVGGAVKNANGQQTEYLKAKLASAERFGRRAMEIAQKERQKRREIERKLWLAQGRLPGVR